MRGLAPRADQLLDGRHCAGSTKCEDERFGATPGRGGCRGRVSSRGPAGDRHRLAPGLRGAPPSSGDVEDRQRDLLVKQTWHGPLGYEDAREALWSGRAAKRSRCSGEAAYATGPHAAIGLREQYGERGTALRPRTARVRGRPALARGCGETKPRDARELRGGRARRRGRRRGEEKRGRRGGGDRRRWASTPRRGRADVRRVALGDTTATRATRRRTHAARRRRERT